MTRWQVDSAARQFWLDDRAIECVIGRSGACDAPAKREGDGCTPRGDWPIRAALLRPDRGFTPPPFLPWRWIRVNDGWSDDPSDPAYNRPARHPHRFSAERLWRADRLYDAIIILGHNDDPPIAGNGSAIFLHVRGGDATEGCVAVAPDAIRQMLSRMKPGDILDIR